MEKLSEIPLWTKWKRPQSVPYPNTWHRFEAKSKNGKIYQIKIVDLTPDRFEEATEFMVKYFYPDEPIASCSKFLEDEVSFHNVLCEQKAVLQQRTSIAAVLDEDVPKPEIVGLQKLLVVSNEDEPAPDLPGYVIRRKAKLMKDLEKNHNPFEIFATDKLFRDFGLCVKPKYRGLNIAYNIVLSIEKLAKTFGIKGTVIACNSIGSQIITERAGYQLLNEIVYNEYKDDEGCVVFPVEGTKSLTFVGIEYDEISSRGYLELQRVATENLSSLLAVIDEDVPNLKSLEIARLQKL